MTLLLFYNTSYVVQVSIYSFYGNRYFIKCDIFGVDSWFFFCDIYIYNDNHFTSVLLNYSCFYNKIVVDSFIVYIPQYIIFS